MKNILLIGSSIISQFTNFAVKNYCVINRGISGLITPNLHRIYNYNQTYEYMIFYCGNNDLKKNIDKKLIVSNIAKYVYEFKQNFTHTTILVLSLLTSPKNHQLKLIDDVLYINRKMKELDNIHYIDINGVLSDTKFYYDDIHFNSRGYEILNLILADFITFHSSPRLCSQK